MRLEIRMFVFGLLISAVFNLVFLAQAVGQSCPRIMVQDSSLNNLVDPPGYKTAPMGTLGGVIRLGIGDKNMILIPGANLGASILEEFMDEYSSEYKMYAVTLAGFGGTAAPPCPSEKTSFADQTWTINALAAIEKLIKDEKIDEYVVVGHWITGTTLALRLAMNHPDQVKGVVLLAGAPRFIVTDTAYISYYETPERRKATVDMWLGPKWFKTVTRETWEDNNFLPGDYAVNPIRARRMWCEAAKPELHVLVRYYCEFCSVDVTNDFDKLKVPTLLLRPGLEDLWFDKQNYMKDIYCYGAWEGVLEKYPIITAKTIPNSRACMWFDQPEAVHKEVRDFLKKADGLTSQ